MELLLNLAWLLMALLACGLWRCSNSAPAGRKFASLLILGCMLVILFPVVSATDDLQPITPDLEEASSTRRSLSHANTHKPSVWHIQPALAPGSTFFVVAKRAWREVPAMSFSMADASAFDQTGRAPPLFFPA